VAQYVVYDGMLPLSVSRARTRATLARALNLPLGRVMRVTTANATTEAEVRLPVAGFAYMESNASLARAFARASNVSTDAVRLLRYSAPKRRLLASEAASFGVTLPTSDALDALWRFYARGAGNATVAREFEALGLRAAGAGVTLSRATATLAVRVAVETPQMDEGQHILERAARAEVVSALQSAGVASPGTRIRAEPGASRIETPEEFARELAEQKAASMWSTSTEDAWQDDARRIDRRALLVFATAPAAALCVFVACARRRGAGGGARGGRRESVRPMRVAKIVL
jgi:hypothetical protein